MKKLLLLVAAATISITTFSQSKGYVKFDSVYIQSSVNAELIILNATRDSTGFLVNKGGGRTEFRRPLRKVNDTMYIIGGIDTLRIKLSGYVTNSRFLDSIAALSARIASPGGTGGAETDPTVSATVKAITSTDISNWNGKEPPITAGSSSQVILGNKTLGTLNGALVGLGNVTWKNHAN